ncbi:GH1 family beta-glucosidase [Saccharothrix coeruleofusca]|uniref:Beta-glucosidase n=1 Tax=Saccharothrix coeruleofusca TaxID=33919 RepID=A0A918AHJ1_9PSEU|nr:GH1 family beta-glucosidase [Saccharothrix coeruleofusca]MBP2339996.1 beta-glucosidase [Saccharothrix coeruleofusca]GGP38083.1 beta-glucosidase [Saccharothrix coeruleofusca]
MPLPDFLWGVSTSAFQIEGAFTEDGRAPSVWDEFPSIEGHTAEIACDHRHRYAEDVALMRDLGVDAYRFSVSWPRVEGTGLDFYDRLVDELLAADIRPVVTLYHWDTPRHVEDAGGWLNRDTASRFADYAAAVAARLVDRVAMWIPLNEPAMTTLLGYAIGQHAPGKALLYDALPTAHHLNLAHGLAVRALRAAGAAAVGTANNHTPVWPASPSDDDRAAAAAYSALHNWLYADPVLAGRYPEELADRLPVRDGDLATIAQPLDFYGVNYYNPTRLRAPSEGNPLPFELVDIAEHPKTGYGWPVVPSGLEEIVAELRRRHPALPPVHITENGCSYPHEIADTARIAYLDAHVEAALRAGASGYFVWSLLDNFEWDSGYTQRFGLVHVDYETQRRTPRDSFRWYRDRIRRDRTGR